ncbi:MAG TPA: phosphotransferase family protein [Acidimicrobiales bacterium]|nr:phosphotransferase family protein [Acidimicrobiales bacterium]
MDLEPLEQFLGRALGDNIAIEVTPMAGGGSCEIFALDRGDSRWVLRRAPRHASSSTAHDVLREFRILDAIKDQSVPIARPVISCSDPHVFGAPFYVMERINGVPVRSSIPPEWASAPDTHGRALEEMIDALVSIHSVDWRGTALGTLEPRPDYLSKQIERWIEQLDSYGGRDLPTVRTVAEWLRRHRPPDQELALCHGDYKLDNLLFDPAPPPRLLAVVDWEMAAVGDPLVDLAWALIFHPGPEGTMPLGRAKEPAFSLEHLPDRSALIERYSAGSGRAVGSMAWYDVFSRWKLAIVLEGSYAKFLRGLSDKPLHEFFGSQVDLLLASSSRIVEEFA